MASLGSKAIEALPFWDEVQVLEGQHWISRDFKGRGDFEFSGNLRISGEWTGRILSKDPEASLHVLQSAVVSGDIRAPRVSVEGQLRDVEIEADWLRVMKGAKISGRVRAKVLVVDEGALVEGRITARRG